MTQNLCNPLSRSSKDLYLSSNILITFFLSSLNLNLKEELRRLGDEFNPLTSSIAMISSPDKEKIKLNIYIIISVA